MKKNNKLVWNETVDIVQGLFDVWGRDRKEVFVENVNKITVAVSLHIRLYLIS